MNVIILTQDDPFYLAENLDYLLSRCPSHIRICGCIVFDVSPFGKRESFIAKAKKTLDIFGLRFFLRYSLMYIKNKSDKTKDVNFVLKKYGIPIIQIKNNINSEQSLRIVKEYNPDLLVSIAANQIFKKPKI